MSNWEQRHPGSALVDVAPADTIVLLSGGVAEPGQLRRSFELDTSGDRLLTAFKLMILNKAEAIWVADGKLDKSNNLTTSSSAEILQSWGVDANRIVVAKAKANTADELNAYKKHPSRKTSDKVILVTSALHMPRAMLLLKQQGLESTAVPANHVVGNVGVSLSSFIPSVTALVGSTRTLTEMMAFAYMYHSNSRAEIQ